MGRKPFVMSKEHREKIRQAQLARWGVLDIEKCIFSRRTVKRIVYLSAKYKTIRDEVLEEKGKICELCDATEKIEVHHKITLRELIDEFFKIKGCGVSRLDIYQWEPFYNKYNLCVRCESCHLREVVSHRKGRSVGSGYKCFEALRKLRELDFKK